ncbi:circadian clock-controlled protein daywake [Manduca sexta]|uniref:circadian clock-controlled protein daywake n=1 Tax=Manduca sexta TaxID=7130 RepID=UPI00188E9463|nr:circadian clock-controlled protein daywake [Manduca sexta]
MFCGHIFVVALSVAGILAAPKKKVACALNDLSCTTLTADPLFKSIMRGRPDLNVPASEPLREAEISGRLDDMYYNLTDAELHGMSDCSVKSHNINFLQLSWSFLLYCPKLVLQSNYDLSGSIRNIPIEGRGRSNIVHEKYRIGMRGGFDVVLDLKGRPHVRINHYDIDRLEVVGNIRSDFSNLYNGDVARSAVMHKYLNDNWKSIGFYTQYPTMRSFMKRMMENLIKFLQVVPANELFFREE